MERIERIVTMVERLVYKYKGCGKKSSLRAGLTRHEK